VLLSVQYSYAGNVIHHGFLSTVCTVAIYPQTDSHLQKLMTKARRSPELVSRVNC